MEKQEEMKPHADLIQLSPCQGCPAWHSSVVPEALVCQDSALVTDMQEGGAPLVDPGNGVVLELTPEVPEPGLAEVRNQSVLVQSQESSLWAPGQWEVPMQPLESIRPQCAMEGLRHYQTDGSSKRCADYSDLGKQNRKLLRALEELQHCCTSLKEENCLLRKNYFPETEEKVKHLKRKNAELALIAKRLEERARKLQEANLKVVNAPVAMKGSSLELCKKACAHQRAKDLTEQASALLAKDKQIEALQQECRELQAKLTAGKEGPHCLNLLDFDHLLRESQKEVLRLQRQIALKNFKESLQSSKTGSKSSSSIAANCLGPSVPTLDTSINYSSLSKGVQLGEPTLAMEAHRKVEPGVLPLGHASEEYENFPPKSVVADPESSQQTQQLEFELRKKRKKCENLEHEVRKKHKRCKELEIQLQVVQGENARLAQENTQLNGKAEWARQVEFENADLKLQVVLVTKERDSALQKSQGLQTKLENLEQVLKHMRDVAERRQQLEAEHEEAQLALQEKQEEVRWLQQAQAEAKREHEGAVQLLEAQVRDLEDQCRSHIEQFSLLSQELKRFQLQTGKTGPLTSTLVTSELPLMPCCSIPQSQCRQWEKDPDVAPARPALQCTKKIHDEGSKELESLPQIPDPMSSVTKIPGSGAAATSQKQVKRLESQSSSSKSESMQNSPKSCPTPEVDTASEMEELDIDSISLIPESESQGPAKLQVFLARYSYNPFDGPNENPESELPLTAGEYIYIYGDMDEDGFFEGELMDGRRGLVPSNFVERVSDDDLMTFLPPEVNDLTQSSCRERSFVGASTSSGERSDRSADEASVSPLPSRPEDQEEPVNHTAVPYPRKLTVIKELSSSIVVGWEPPLLPAGSTDVQSYNVYVDAELCQNVKSGSQTKAVIEKLDLELKAYRISVQSVTEQGSSDKLRCTFCVGQDFCIAPMLLKIRSMTATSAEITWLPCNSNYGHAVYLNEEECDITKPGVYWYTFHSLRPSTQYVAKVEARPPRVLWELPQERREQKSAAIHFTTPLAGTPDAPLDVQAEPGPSAGILVISWLPVTIDAEGSSNGVRVTGYAVYADGQKVMEVASPTAGSVLVELSQLQMFQVCREVSVRTMSLYGESADSVPAQIPSALLKASRHSSLSQAVVSTSLTSRLLCGEPKGSHPKRMPVTHCTAPLFPPQKCSTDGSDAKFTVHTTPSCDGSVNCLPGKISPHLRLSSPRVSSVQVLGTSSPVSDTARDEQCLISLPQPTGVGEEPEPSRAAALKGPGEDIEAQGTEELSVSKEPELESSDGKMPMETCHACFVEERLQESTIDRERKANEQCLSPEPQLSTHQAELGVDSCRDSDRNGSVSPGKKLMKEISRGDSSLMVPKVKREASDNEDLRLQELLGSPAWQTPTRKGNKALRRSRILKSSISSSGSASEAVVTDNSVRIFVALFDYDPISMSPNPDAAEEELPFKEGQILKVCGDKDADGFYRGECAGRAGYIPCNMVSEVQVDSAEVRKELLKQGYIPAATSVESIGNGTFAPPPRRLTVPPPKPRRAKKAELEKQENYKPRPGSSWQDLGADLITPRTMVAAFDYNPRESSPNVDVEAELTFTAGDVITVFGSMDDDGFYYGELNRQRGLVPSNFLEAVSLDGGMTEGLHLEDQDTCAVNAESQLNSDGPGEQRDPLPNIPEVPPSCTLICDPSPDQASLETLESSDLSTQSKKKRSFFCKGKKLLKKLGPSKKN
ncbi:peripheral-type benzodiazepine receptor-associated protein 1 isoform X18 [Chrysemys picta bellii]|uniref:peripheral-type benzodiazepine receptor-associated protein 1 isoform X18 n=1 Tax=Chrysemys picta bellii TaxID=8478 RepID=UPI0032B14167